MLDDARRRVDAVDALALLDERAEVRTFCELPVEPAEPAESRPVPVLLPDEAV